MKRGVVGQVVRGSGGWFRVTWVPSGACRCLKNGREVGPSSKAYVANALPPIVIRRLFAFFSKATAGWSSAGVMAGQAATEYT